MYSVRVHKGINKCFQFRWPLLPSCGQHKYYTSAKMQRKKTFLTCFHWKKMKCRKTCFPCKIFLQHEINVTQKNDPDTGNFSFIHIHSQKNIQLLKKLLLFFTCRTFLEKKSVIQKNNHGKPALVFYLFVCFKEFINPKQKTSQILQIDHHICFVLTCLSGLSYPPLCFNTWLKRSIFSKL